MQESFHEPAFFRWRRAFPWLHLLRIPGIAFRTQILLVGFLTAFFYLVCGLVARTLTDQTTRAVEPGVISETGLLSARQNLFHDAADLAEQAVAPNIVMFNLTDRLKSLEFSPLILADLLYWFNFLFFGIIICRMACAEFTQGKGVCLERASVFALKKLPAVLTGILFPLFLAALVFLFVFGILAIGKIPVIGLWVGGILYGATIPLLFFAAVLMIGLGIGWPMILSVIACENSDSFDAFSRTFDYLRSRLPVILAAFAITMAVGILIVGCAEEVSRLAIQQIDILQNRMDSLLTEQQARQPDRFRHLWLTLWSNLLHGYLVAYYWCTVCGIYILTRQSVDQTPVDEFQQEPGLEQATDIQQTENEENGTGA